tara:strand:- start:195 stop:398 length:204 start_codon:yes stop_codon:yes gene_type:complete
MKYVDTTYYLDGYFPKNTSLSYKLKDCMAVSKAILYRLLLLIDTGKIPDIIPDRLIIMFENHIIADW